MSSKNRDIPTAILGQIQQAAKDLWGDDSDMLEDEINTEVEAYLKLQESTFCVPSEVKKEIIDAASEVFDTWDERLSFVEEEIEAFKALQAIETQAVLGCSVLKKVKEAAMRKHPTGYSYQHNYVENALRIEPVKKLLLKMESIIGGECYNGNI